ncbi:hypothetical protein [Tardiphaga sp. 367_B4_N1_1]|uniref:hypothetical protein n=1 Tax=Tardiphaga sp. 367_B4_N1_1 TaxID=3240777 RepID=UPI003F1F6849
MNIDQSTVPQPGTVNLSTTLDPNTVNLESGGGVPALNEPEDKGADSSIESVLDAELKSLRAADKDEKDDKTEVDEKPLKDAKAEKEPKDVKVEKEDRPARERQQDGKFAKAEKAEAAVEGKEGAPEKVATEQDGSERRPSEGRQHVEPPARFLPKEREAWGNVPNVVKSAISRLSQEHEAEVSQYRDSHDNWQKLSKFDEMAKSHKTTVSDALERYTALDGLLQSQPLEAIRQILGTRGITPEQYAQHVMSNPEAHRAPATPPTPDPAVRQMSSEVENLKSQLEEMRTAQAAATIIEPFRAANPRYDELQDDIAFFLQSGKIPASLTPQDRLEAAYDMAVRINPTSAVETLQPREAPAAKTERPAKLDAGTKSIRGAPDDGADTEIEETDEDLTKMLRKELRRMSA